MNEPIPGPAATPGYRAADLVGDILYVAGQVPLDRFDSLVGPAEPARQATQCLDSLRILVEHQGFDVADIHRLVVYVVGPHQNLLDAWDATTEWFDGEAPPSTLLGVSCLGYRDQLVEIDATVDRGARMVERRPDPTDG